MAQHAGDLHDCSGLPLKPALNQPKLGPAWKLMSPEDVRFLTIAQLKVFK